MEGFGIVRTLGDTRAAARPVTATRNRGRLLLVPLFTAYLVPAMVRNAMFIAIALLSLLMQPSAGPIVLEPWQWISLFAKEASSAAPSGFSSPA
jgi:type III secretion protein T